MNKTSVFLTQRKDVDPETPGKALTFFVVTKLVNCLEPEIGSKLSFAEAQALVVGDSTVTITGSKQGF